MTGKFQIGRETKSYSPVELQRLLLSYKTFPVLMKVKSTKEHSKLLLCCWQNWPLSYAQCMSYDCNYFVEVVRESRCRRVIALNLEHWSLHRFRATNTIIATGIFLLNIWKWYFLWSLVWGIHAVSSYWNQWCGMFDHRRKVKVVTWSTLNVNVG